MKNCLRENRGKMRHNRPTNIDEAADMKTITLKADARLIETARQLAAAERTTLDAKFREWLEGYTRTESTEEKTRRRKQAERAMAGIEEMCKTVRTGGRKFTREEMNER